MQDKGQAVSWLPAGRRDGTPNFGDWQLALVGLLAVVLFAGLLVVTKDPIVSAGALVAVPAVALLCMKPVWLVYAIVVYSFVVKFLVGDLGLPSLANYVCDGLLVLALVFAAVNPKPGYRSTPAVRRIGIAVMLFAMVATGSAILNGVEPLLYVWAIRNTFRLFGFFYCCVRLLDGRDVQNIMKFFVVFFWLNVLVCTYQYFVLGTGQDNTNGLLGTGSGGNAMTNVLLFAMMAYRLFGYSSGKVRLWRVLLMAAACCYISAIAEIKVFYVELVLLIGLTVVLQKPSFRTIAVVVLTILALIVGIQVLTAFYPFFAEYFTLDSIIKASSDGGYSNEYNLNRLTAVTTLDGMFMNSLRDHMIGLGFGAGQYCQFFEAPLYGIYGELLNWNWFTDAAVFLETGWLGLSLYVITLVLMAVGAFQNRNRAGSDAAVIRMSLSVIVLSLLLIVYNCTLTVDPGCYFVAVLFSFPYVYGGICAATNAKEGANGYGH